MEMQVMMQKYMQIKKYKLQIYKINKTIKIDKIQIKYKKIMKKLIIQIFKIEEVIKINYVHKKDKTYKL